MFGEELVCTMSEFKYSKEWFFSKFPQLLAVLSGTLSVVSDGMEFGWTAPILPILRNSTATSIQITQANEHWLEHIYLIGGFAGIPLTLYSVDKFGRKKTILLSSIQHGISWTLIATASSVEFFFIARFIAGLAGDIAFISIPMYIGEIADQEIRGALSGITYLMMLIGILIIYSVAPFVSITTSSMVGATFVVVQLITFSFMPESPYYLLFKGKQASALKSLQRLRSNINVEEELKEISTAVERQSSESGRPIDLLVVPSNRKALIIVVMLYAAQHCGSITVMVMNMHTILGDAAAILSPSSAAIMFSVIMLLSASASALLIDKAGRKILLSTSSLSTGITLLALATYFAVKNSGVDVSHANWIPVVAVMLFAFTFRYGLGTVSLVLAGELFPTRVKAMGMSISDCSYLLFAIVSIVIYQQLEGHFGMHWPFFVFSASCFLITIFIVVYIPETKGRTLEEIQYILKGLPLPDTKNNGLQIINEENRNETNVYIV